MSSRNINAVHIQKGKISAEVHSSSIFFKTIGETLKEEKTESYLTWNLVAQEKI